jgi:8-oxo-dGTP diphosphatase
MTGTFRNPLPTVDIVIEIDGGVVLIERRNPPHGWALPGGFIDYGESAESCAVREAREETGLAVQLTDLLYVYSQPERDPRHHTLTTVFIATAQGLPVAADDARSAAVFNPRRPPEPLVFDHAAILADYCNYRDGGSRQAILQRHCGSR